MNAQIVLENVGVRLPNRVLFSEVNWTLYEGMRVALAGRNGSGKSTLLRIMAGRTESSEGRCNYVGGRKLRIGFLDQTLLDSAVVEMGHLKERSLSAVDYLKEKLTAQDDDHETSDEEREWEIRKTLSGLGFSKEWADGPMSKLSGGWLLRVFIGLALLEKPEVLFLDEPTNHLDISSIQWLEEFLQNEYKGSLILITHDVALQKRVTDSLAVLHGGKFFFRDHQRDYLTFRSSLGEEKRLIEKQIESLQGKIDENMDFFYKFRAKAQTANRAQSKLKAAEDLTTEMNELKDRLIRIEGFSYNLSFNFRMSGPGGKFPVSTKNLNFRYKEDAPWIIHNFSTDIKRGQRVAIMGDNGAGKTTLLNLIGDRLQATEGDIMKGHAIEQGYFGQHQLDELSLDDTVVENLRARAFGVGLEELRGWLGAFGFCGNDEIAKKAKVLSGGERARLALLRILLTRVNLLLLDEPTNHLDIETKELLKNAIRSFEGTVLIVSHDREFIGDIAERIIYLTTDHQITDHLGNLESFFEKYPQFVRHFEGKAKPSQAPKSSEKKSSPTSNLSFEERKKIKNQIRSLEKKIAAAEIEMDRIGKEKEALETGGGSQDALAKLQSLDTALTAKMTEWEKWSTELENLRKIAPDIQ